MNHMQQLIFYPAPGALESGQIRLQFKLQSQFYLLCPRHLNGGISYHPCSYVLYVPNMMVYVRYLLKLDIGFMFHTQENNHKIEVKFD